MAHFTESKNHFLRGAKTTNYKHLLQTRMPNHKKKPRKTWSMNTPGESELQFQNGGQDNLPDTIHLTGGRPIEGHHGAFMGKPL